MTARKAKAGIKPGVVAAISAALALYGYTVGEGYQVKSITKKDNPWRKAGVMELMLSRELNRDFL